MYIRVLPAEFSHLTSGTTPDVHHATVNDAYSIGNGLNCQTGNYSAPPNTYPPDICDVGAHLGAQSSRRLRDANPENYLNPTRFIGLVRYTPLRRSRAVLRRSPIRKQSARHRAEQRRWLKRKAERFEEVGGACEIESPVCVYFATDAHHSLAKSQGGNSSNCDPVIGCTPCHRYAHANRKWAESRGFIIRRSDNDPITPSRERGAA